VGKSQFPSHFDLFSLGIHFREERVPSFEMHLNLGLTNGFASFSIVSQL
jgi:hypothetical protein